MTDCTAGQTTMPTECDRHANHHWCGACEGFYGVPHTGVHDVLNQHPRDLHSARQCACRPCQHPRDLHSARQCACRPCQQYVAAYEARANA